MADRRRRRRRLDAELENVDEEEEVDKNHLVFVDTNLDTSLVILVSDTDSFADLRRKLMLEHLRCFPQLGEISIDALKIKQKGRFYHLPDSMPVKIAFERKTNGWYLSVDASSLKNLCKNDESCGPNTSNQLPLLRLCHNPSNNEGNFLLDDASTSAMLKSPLLEPLRSQCTSQNVQLVPEGSFKGFLEEAVPELKHITNDYLKNTDSNRIPDLGTAGRTSENDRNRLSNIECNNSMEASPKTGSVMPVAEKKQKIEGTVIDETISEHGRNSLEPTPETGFVRLVAKKRHKMEKTNEDGVGDGVLKENIVSNHNASRPEIFVHAEKTKHKTAQDPLEYRQSNSVEDNGNDHLRTGIQKKNKKKRTRDEMNISSVYHEITVPSVVEDVEREARVKKKNVASNLVSGGDTAVHANLLVKADSIASVVDDVSVVKETKNSKNHDAKNSKNHDASKISHGANESGSGNDLKLVSEVEKELPLKHDSELLLSGKSKPLDDSADFVNAKAVMEDRNSSGGKRMSKRAKKPAAILSQAVKDIPEQKPTDAPLLDVNTNVSQYGDKETPQPASNAKEKGTPVIAGVSVVKETIYAEKHNISKTSHMANENGPSNGLKVVSEVERELPQKHESEVPLTGKSKPIDYSADLVNAKVVVEDETPGDGSKKKKKRAMKLEDVKEISEQNPTDAPTLDVNINVSQNGAPSSYDHDQAKICELVRNAEEKGIPSDLVSVSVVKETKHSKKHATSKIRHVANKSGPSILPKVAGEVETELPEKHDSEPLISGKSKPLDYTADLVNAKAVVEDRNPSDGSKKKKKKATKSAAILSQDVKEVSEQKPTDAPTLDVNTHVSQDRAPTSYDHDQVKTPEPACTVEGKGIPSDLARVSVLKETKRPMKHATCKSSYVVNKSGPSNDPKVVSEVERELPEKLDSELLLTQKINPLDCTADLGNVKAAVEDRNPSDGNKRKKLKAKKSDAMLSQAVKEVSEQKPTDAPSLDVNSNVSQDGDPPSYVNDQAKAPEPACNAEGKCIHSDLFSESVVKKKKHSKKHDTSKISHVAKKSGPKVLGEVERELPQKCDSELLLSEKCKPLDNSADLVNAKAMVEDKNPGDSKRKKMRATKPIAVLSQAVKEMSDAPSLDGNNKSRESVSQYRAPRPHDHDQVKTPPLASRSVIGGVSRDSTPVSNFKQGKKVSSVSAKSTTGVKSSLQREKSLFTTPGAIFNDDSSESSDDEKRTKYLNSSAHTPFHNEYSSVSDRESDFSLDSQKKGPSGVERKDGGESKKPQSSNMKNTSLASIFQSSSVYKKAKLRAESQLDPEDLESQPVDCVPDSQPYPKSAAHDLMQYCNSQNF